MKIISSPVLPFLKLLLLSMLLMGCSKNDYTTQPQIADKDSVGCLITNDFYAVHFSAYLKPSQNEKGLAGGDRDALLRPYCQELPGTGKAFFAADLIDRDIRKTPIGIRLVELEQSGKDETKAESFKEVSTILEVEPKLYPTGVVETQADIKKNGFYALYLIIGGEEALSEDDKLRIQFHVGGNPDGLSKTLWVLLISGLLIGIISAGLLIFYIRKKRHAKLTASPLSLDKTRKR